MVLCDSTSSSYSKEYIRSVKLISGKSLYFMHKNDAKHSGEPFNSTPFLKNECFKSIEKVIQVLGSLNDESSLDKEGTRILDIAMVDYVRETNNLNSCQRCLLCHANRKLRRSHVIPQFILASFAKGMHSTASKKVYVSFEGDEHKSITARQAVWWMLCSSCELLLSAEGESSFAKEFFHQLYQSTNPSNPTQEHKISYSKWLYHFVAGIVFRGLAVNPKGITGFCNDDHLYQLFTACREILLNKTFEENYPQIAIFANPLSTSSDHSQAASTLNRLLNMPGFMYLAESDEKLQYTKIPKTANFFIAHLGVINVVAPIVGGNFILPENAIINTKAGIFSLPHEGLRLKLLPPALWELLVLIAQKLEEEEIKITEKRLQEANMYDTTPAEALKRVYGLAKAKQSDVYSIEEVGFQPSSDPKFPKRFNLLPPNISVNRGINERNSLSLPLGHKLLLHKTLGSDSEGVTFFLCIDSESGKLYIVKHRYMQGLYLDFGFIVSDDMIPQEQLPDKNPKVYTQYLLDDLKSSQFIQQSFSKFFHILDITSDDLRDAHTRFVVHFLLLT